MLFFVRTADDFSATDALREESERRLQFATDRFKGEIDNIGILLEDVNGPRGGVDKLCRITTKLRRGRSLVIEESRASFETAITAAAKKLQRMLARRIGGKAGRNVRHYHLFLPDNYGA